MRTSHHILGNSLGLFHTLFSDDGLLGQSFPNAPISIFLVLLFFDVLQVPLSWHKVRGGTEVDYIGYRLSLETFFSRPLREKGEVAGRVAAPQGL